jgi:serine/threonine-protein kinase
MSNSNRLTVTTRDLDFKDKEFSFETGDLCVIGRADDCEIQLPGYFLHAGISRHHCMIEVEAANAWVRDLGSLNGTLLNGELIGQRRGSNAAINSAVNGCLRRQLHDGDEIKVGNVILSIGIQVLADNLQSEYLSMGHR